MRQMKRWVAMALSAVLCAGTLCGCGDTEEVSILPVCAGSDVTTFDPAYVSTAADNTVVGNLYENLMRMTTTTGARSTRSSTVSSWESISCSSMVTVTSCSTLQLNSSATNAAVS